MSSYFRELYAVSGVSFMIMGRYIIYTMFPVFLKGAAMYLLDVKGLWRTMLSSAVTQFMIVGAGGIIVKLIHPELEVFSALEGTGIENTALAVLITYLLVYLAVDAVMIYTVNKTFKGSRKAVAVTGAMDALNVCVMCIMFSHQIIITI
ncbi:MAG: hypothetical protein IJ696_01950 [Ruminococcus sp.]|nr:hypothetical protein [Ruminococcus sp.]